MVVSGAGGVGSLAVQLAKPIGAGRVIATASTEEKRALALELGADAAVDPATGGPEGRARSRPTSGRPVDVVFEMSGGRVFDAERRGARAVRAASSPTGSRAASRTTLATGRLMRKSRAVVGFWLMHCLGRRDMMRGAARDLFERAARGELVPQIGDTYALVRGAPGARGPPGRRTTGKLLLDPLPLASRTAMTTFAELGLSEPILEALDAPGLREPRPRSRSRRSRALLEGRDVIGQAQTGTGKTAAFGLPLLEYIDPSDPRSRRSSSRRRASSASR